MEARHKYMLSLKSKKKCASTSVNANKFYLPLAAGGLQEVADWRDLDWTMAADDAEAYQPYDHLHDLILSEMRVMEELGQGAWGKVFLCHFPSLSSKGPVVMKIPLDLLDRKILFISRGALLTTEDLYHHSDEVALANALADYKDEFKTYERIMDPRRKFWGAQLVPSVGVVKHAEWKEELGRMEKHPGHAHIHRMLHFDAGIPAIFSEECHGTLTSLRRYRPALFEVVEPALEMTALWKQIGREIADAVDYMRTRNVVHGDLKTDNILFVEASDGAFRFVVSDFGLCKSNAPKDFFFRTTEYFAPTYWTANASLVYHPMTLCVYTVAMIMVCCLNFANERFPLFMHEPFEYYNVYSDMVDNIETFADYSPLGALFFPPPDQELPADYEERFPSWSRVVKILHYDYWDGAATSNYALLQAFRLSLH